MSEIEVIKVNHKSEEQELIRKIVYMCTFKQEILARGSQSEKDSFVECLNNRKERLKTL